MAIVEKQSDLNPIMRGFATETGGRNTHAIALIDDALRQAQMERESIDCIAIGLGPGSYTGIRSAIALAQGWQLGCEIKLLGIGSVDCLAAQVFATGVRGDANFIVDAQRNEFYLAKYSFAEDGFHEVEPLNLASSTEVELRIAAGQLVIGPESKRKFPSATDLMPDARTLGQLASGNSKFVLGEQLEPIYLREISFVKAPPPRVILDR